MSAPAYSAQIEPTVRSSLVSKGLNLDRLLYIKTERTLKNDFTIAHDKKLYQIEEAVKTKKLMVEEYTNGSMAIRCQGQKVKFRQIAIKPEKPQKQSPCSGRKKASTPAKDTHGEVSSSFPRR